MIQLTYVKALEVWKYIYIPYNRLTNPTSYFIILPKVYKSYLLYVIPVINLQIIPINPKLK